VLTTRRAKENKSFFFKKNLKSRFRIPINPEERKKEKKHQSARKSVIGGWQT